jgi:hypothetical protein
MSALDALGGFVVSCLVVVLLALLDRRYRGEGGATDRVRAPRREYDDRR